jgi:hypothetical protein
LSQVEASRERILALGSIDLFVSHPLDRPMPRSKVESDGIFSESTVYIFWQFAALPSWLFALSEVRGRPDKRHANICIFQIAVSLVEYRPDVSPPIVSEF